MIVLDNPGAQEDHDGNRLLCRTRQTLQQAASEVGLNGDDLYIIFILKPFLNRMITKEVETFTIIKMRQ